MTQCVTVIYSQFLPSVSDPHSLFFSQVDKDSEIRFDPTTKEEIFCQKVFNLVFPFSDKKLCEVYQNNLEREIKKCN